MIKTLSSITLATLLLAAISGCSDKEPTPETAVSEFGCKQENVSAPNWTCIPKAEDSYAGVGIAENELLSKLCPIVNSLRGALFKSSG